MKAIIKFSNGSNSFSLKNNSEIYVKRAEFDMSQHHESIGKNLYLVHAEDVMIGESIYDEEGNCVAYRIN